MPEIYNNNGEEIRHTDDMQNIITTVPSWILRWGITLFFIILVLIVGLSALIRYPDIVKAQLTVESPSSPKPVVSKISGKIVKLLVHQHDRIKAGQLLAYLESTADHDKVLAMLGNLKELQKEVAANKTIDNVLFIQGNNGQFGELKSSCQAFFQEYLSYKSSVINGFNLKKEAYLLNDLIDIAQQEQQLNIQKSIEQKDLDLATDEYQEHKKLSEQNVETPAEFRQQENKYLAKKSPLIQTEKALLTTKNNYSAKQKEILELRNQMIYERSKFAQALNSLISKAEDWKSKYVLIASQDGTLVYSGTIQEGQVLVPNQEVFYVNQGNDAFFGEMPISQNSIGKVKAGQRVLIKLKRYPYEEYGMLTGRIKYITDVPYKDSLFVSKVDFELQSRSDMKKPVHLKQGMIADADIITQDASILQRISRNFTKEINNK
ncbi:HlyD family secretion protein [Mucilaginibacter sp. X5P1]|uniref:HlyD family secretion protein n=1 Tax=Mucilaginibacter sp. X5P1 TaxID=2723088 RepID=UPI00161A2253|nr:HlyD family efflux transporter periplasmic adaptor subunit [Mucilaginibacter sp. X5P1]MBB6138284.1 HlyD family secretion protein [Mucilaginibacter sp. X5P1]